MLNLAVKKISTTMKLSDINKNTASSSFLFPNTFNTVQTRNTCIMDSMCRGLMKTAMGWRPTSWRRFIAFPLTSSRQCLPCQTHTDAMYLFQIINSAIKSLKDVQHNRQKGML